MPQRRSGIKDLRKNRRQQMRNLDVKTALKKTIKKFTTAVSGKNSEEAQTVLKTAYKKLDKAAKIKIITNNTAARRKSRLAKSLKSIA